MKNGRRILLAMTLLAAAGVVAADEEPTEESQCITCHGTSDLWEGDTLHLYVTPESLSGDIHWQKGLTCHDCHGGNHTTFDLREAHAIEDGFRKIATPADIPAFCGHCHSNTEYMRRYRPSPRTDQEMEYWTSGHGQALKKAAEQHKQALENVAAGEEPPEMENPRVATCLSCHSEGGKHNILAVDDQKSPVYPTRVAPMCATCHSDAELMDGRTYHGRPLGHDQYELWKTSVHGQAMLKNGDLSAPTCNDCHGNHGAVPPDVDSVANACGTCHVKVAKLFDVTRMKHQFEEVGLPGCAACHGNHQTLSPNDEMLGMEGDAVCAGCHQDNKHGATLAGADAARAMRQALENLKQQIAEAEATVAEAERLGMEVRGPRFDLRQSQDALTNARSQIHTFAAEPVQEAVGVGLKVTSEVTTRAQQALDEHTNRRIWLAASLVPILVVVVLLLLYIRNLPLPSGDAARE